MEPGKPKIDVARTYFPTWEQAFSKRLTNEYLHNYETIKIQKTEAQEQEVKQVQT